MATCIIVLGQPRSGTSMTAGVLHHLGVTVGERLMPASSMNQRGHYVDLSFDELFSHSVDGLPAADFRASAAVESAAAPLIRQRNGRGVWGLKCLFAHTLIPLLSEICNVKLVRTTRSLDVSVRSLLEHTRHDERTAAKIIMWGKHVADYWEKRLPSMTLDFDSALGDPRSAVLSLANFAGVDSSDNATRFIDRSLRRF